MLAKLAKVLKVNMKHAKKVGSDTIFVAFTLQHRPMPSTYSQYIIGQEEPEEMPNDVAYHLSQLLGCPPRVAYQALAKVDPKIDLDAWGNGSLPCEAMGPVAAEVTSSLVAAAQAYRQALKLTMSVKNRPTQLGAA